MNLELSNPAGKTIASLPDANQSDGHVARQLLGTVLKDNPEDAKKLRQYFDVVVKSRAKKSRAWQSYWEARKSLDR